MSGFLVEERSRVPSFCEVALPRGRPHEPKWENEEEVFNH